MKEEMFRSSLIFGVMRWRHFHRSFWKGFVASAESVGSNITEQQNENKTNQLFHYSGNSKNSLCYKLINTIYI